MQSISTMQTTYGTATNLEHMQEEMGGGTLVFTRRGSKAVHSIIPDEREWLSVLACINAAGHYIPHFFIFKGKHMRRNYIQNCETNSTMAMQEKT
jgi:hypothetical protein